MNAKVWPHSELVVSITFMPHKPLAYSCSAFCNITCCENRLPLMMTGNGVGPKASFPLWTKKDLGDIFVDSKKSCEFVVENKGDIDCH